jgi:hypothetical protein
VTDDEPELEESAEVVDEEAADSTEVIVPRQRFRAATQDELDPQNFMVAEPRSALRAVLRGGSIARDRGDAGFIGQAINRLAHALREGAERFREGTVVITNPQLRQLRFGNSVEIELEIGPGEQVQMGIDGQRHAPTIDAARALAGMMRAEPEELLPQALELGDETIVAYKQFLEVLSSDDAVLEWQAPDLTDVMILSSVDARVDHTILSREGEKETQTVRVPGTLSMADSDLNKFALTLPSELGRPPLLKGKHRVHGTYPEDVGTHLKSEGLWDSNVMATIEVTFDVPGTTATPRDKTYVLVGAEPLLPESAGPRVA